MAGKPRPGKGLPFAAKTYRSGSFLVTIQADGAIKVKSGDMISKYCACLYGDPMMGWEEFGRRIGNRIQRLPDPNSIRVGETIYHIPTAKRATVDLEPIHIAAAAWVQMRFMLAGEFATATKGPVGAMYFTGHLKVCFSDDQRVYQWRRRRILFTVISAPTSILKGWLQGFDGGFTATKWSSPTEFRLNSFDPRVYWKKVRPSLGIMIVSVGSREMAKARLSFAIPKKTGAVRQSGVTVTSAHIEMDLEFDKISVNFLPSFDFKAGEAWLLDGFHKTGELAPKFK